MQKLSYVCYVASTVVNAVSRKTNNTCGSYYELLICGPALSLVFYGRPM